MAFSLSGAGGFLLKMVVNPLLWLILIVAIIGITLLFLKIRKKRKLVFPTIEIVDMGNGKTGLNLLKSGWFGEQSYLFGLWDRGREIMKTEDGDIVEDFSTEDFQEVNGDRGIVIYRDPNNRGIVVPINNLNVKNKHLVAEIAPASFRDVAVDIVKEAEEETRDWKQQLIAWAVIGGVVIFALVSIIVIVQMVKNGQDKAASLIVDAGKTCLENAKSICSEINTARTSAAP